ncbi:MAG TPA: TonB-dependent receptor [Candidatus Marinimicrobia bacterium]|nr:TonB-dependent receptor [Candidatus Neomarinimicrobiota bacterium]HQK10718.1 TonB-dependent receptor [Candidatus Neomarinimicrobiota bacterium]
MHQKNLPVFFFILFILILTEANAFGEEHLIFGKLVSETTGQPVESANILLEDGSGTFSDKDGNFRIKTSFLPIKVTVTHIAFRDTSFSATSEDCGTIYLKPTVITGEYVFVTATRAVKGKTPVAFSELSIEEIKSRYTVEDVPMILAIEPGVYSYSESGNGTGYSYVQIRGFDQSRIAVMLNNVPLNDNESHQVYWVDHGDILSDAADVQIQRGIGNSLYGSSAFGGSINVLTTIGTDRPTFSIDLGGGSYNTSKIRLGASSGQLHNGKLRLSARLSQIESDGYREYHETFQRSGSAGIEYNGQNTSHQFRALVGYQKSNLMWDGVPAELINDRVGRRSGYKSYIDNFLQQVYSLNSTWRISENLNFNNVAYLVKGDGYYESEKSAAYNLAVDDATARDEFRDFLRSFYLDQYYPTDADSQSLELTRRKWIVNSYYGIVPTLTFIKAKYRLDIGGEFKYYNGNHFGEISRFSDQNLIAQIGKGWYRYYRYIGEKSIATGFVHFTLEPLKKLKLITDLQYQHLQWNLDQKKIGYAIGYDISAKWDFLNPRFGAIYELSNDFSIFANYGRSQKEPADEQIIEADDYWSEPQKAAAELIDDYELGANYRGRKLDVDLNLYRINYKNEQLKNIDIEQEGEYVYTQASATIHEGLEWEVRYQFNPLWALTLNGTFSRHVFESGSYKGNTLPNIPGILFNGSLDVKPVKNLSISAIIRYVGEQYIDEANIGMNPAYWLTDVGLRYSFGRVEIGAKVNNLFNRLYSTYGYGYEWGEYYAYYWPGATRNAFFSISYHLD